MEVVNVSANRNRFAMPNSVFPRVLPMVQCQNVVTTYRSNDTLNGLFPGYYFFSSFFFSFLSIRFPTKRIDYDLAKVADTLSSVSVSIFSERARTSCTRAGGTAKTRQLNRYLCNRPNESILLSTPFCRQGNNYRINFNRSDHTSEHV